MKEIIAHNNFLDIKLHPIMNIKDVERMITKFKSIFKDDLPNIRIINLDNNIQKHILNSDICIFGESTYVNLAIEMKRKVFCIRTSFFFDAPILNRNKTYNYLTIY